MAARRRNRETTLTSRSGMRKPLSQRGHQEVGHSNGSKTTTKGARGTDRQTTFTRNPGMRKLPSESGHYEEDQGRDFSKKGCRLFLAPKKSRNGSRRHNSQTNITSNPGTRKPSSGSEHQEVSIRKWATQAVIRERALGSTTLVGHSRRCGRHLTLAHVQRAQRQPRHHHTTVPIVPHTRPWYNAQAAGNGYQ